MRRWGEGKNEKVGRRNKREGLEKDKMKWLRVIYKLMHSAGIQKKEKSWFCGFKIGLYIYILYI